MRFTRSSCKRQSDYARSRKAKQENKAFVRDFHQKVKVEDVKTKLACETSLKKWKWKMWKRSFRARLPSKSESGRYENEAFVRVLSLKIWNLKMCKRSFRARHPSKSESGRCENQAIVRDISPKVKVEDMKTKLSCEPFPSKNELGRCENEAFVRYIPQSLTVEDVKTKLSCETSLEKWKWQMWKRSFRARLPSNFETSRCENDTWTGSSTAGPIREGSRYSPDRLATARRKSFLIHLAGHVLCCKTQHVVHPLTFKNPFRASPFRQKLTVEDVKTNLSCESFPSKSNSVRCENEALVRDIPRKVKVEDVKTKLSCETSLKKWKWKMWKRSFRASPFPQNLKVEDIKRKLSCETSFCREMCLLWNRVAVKCLCCETSLLGDVFAVRSLCCEIPLLWHPFALTSKFLAPLCEKACVCKSFSV